MAWPAQPHNLSQQRTARSLLHVVPNNNIKLRVAGLKSQNRRCRLIRASVSLSAAKSGEVAKCTADEYLFVHSSK